MVRIYFFNKLSMAAYLNISGGAKEKILKISTINFKPLPAGGGSGVATERDQKIALLYA